MLTAFARKLRSVDKFGQKPGYKVQYEGGGAYVSYMGALCSVIFIMISLIFLYSKIMVLVNVSRITVISNYQVGALTYDDQYSGEDGFFVAAAFTAYDSETEPIDDPTYGDLTMEYYGWGYEGALSTKNTPLGTHRCSDEELGLSNDVEYPIFATSATEVTTYKKKF